MTAPRLPEPGFTDGAVMQTASGPRIFLDGRWQPLTCSVRAVGRGNVGAARVSVKLNGVTIIEAAPNPPPPPPHGVRP